MTLSRRPATPLNPGTQLNPGTPVPTTPRWRTLRASGLAVVAATLVALTAATPSVALTKNPVKILSPAVVPLSSAEIPNSQRGQYLWMGYASQPAGWPATDMYYRDQTYWGRLETTRGVYNFAPLDDLLLQSYAKGGKGSFRVMSYCPNCWMEFRTDWPKVVPPWMPVQAGLSQRVPDWNSETFLSAWEQLMTALGQRYANDPRLGNVDVGGYGKYGEWWIDSTGEGVPITDANRKRMVTAVVRAFPTKWVLINTMTDTTFTRWVLDTFPKTGMRTDGLGAPNMYSMIPVSPELQSYWKTRPIVTEWATTGDPVAGRDQVSQWHISTTSSANLRLTYDQMTATQKTAYETAVKTSGYRYAVTSVTVPTLVRGASVNLGVTIANNGSAPIYDPRTVTFQLRSSTGTVVASSTSAIDLRAYLPGSTSAGSPLTVPATVAAGTYSLTVRVTDPSGYLPPMKLANTTTTSDGGYVLGSVSVG